GERHGSRPPQTDSRRRAVAAGSPRREWRRRPPRATHRLRAPSRRQPDGSSIGRSFAPSTSRTFRYVVYVPYVVSAFRRTHPELPFHLNAKPQVPALQHGRRLFVPCITVIHF